MCEKINDTNRPNPQPEKESCDLLIRQWERLCAYEEKLDTEHWQAFVVCVAAFGLLSGKTADFADIVVIWILPLLVLLLLYFEAYRLRCVAVLKAYLSILEKRMQEKKQPISWFSKYSATYISNNNRANQFMIVPFTLVFVVISFMSAATALSELKGVSPDLSGGCMECHAAPSGDEDL